MNQCSKEIKEYAWGMAIGLQAVDNIKTSRFLRKIATQHIEGLMTLDEGQKSLNQYYKENMNISEKRVEEADKVSLHIVQNLLETSFSFSTNEYISIHRQLFYGIYHHAGKIRDYNITKKEWVLNGDTLVYGDASILHETLESEFLQEMNFQYENLSRDEIIHHLALFISCIWQFHVFGEGNTRTTAVFLVKYLNSLGQVIENNTFAKYSWYFRNALVRANYTNIPKGIFETREYLELFLRNLLGEKNELHNRDMMVWL